ncbi:hypothetical protein L228DRAFT_280671 [Xylona heveae TC161]|uniref:Uncharacterized protein n=1 Tax=Xylona heveae (strain CBS 132557 / TC161) TaxID=1328760 RepID=A0A165IV08_XYLHT|nr:hypothetical protein L228DRAFT_280671 [Xylona heveae TC161]KZF25429.1 hypothetical protein L228DRAFT_280671 [Xylona heveae TC161]
MRNSSHGGQLQLLCSRIFLLFSVLARLACATTGQEPLAPIKKTVYAPGQAIPVECLNRTIDTGEQISDSRGQLQYVPLPVCNETGRPLELYFGVEHEVNCTIPFITDEFFHQLEFYVHNDAPLTCRIPTRPLPGLDSEREISSPSSSSSSGGSSSSSTSSADDTYTPLIIALTGTLQLSHLHIATNLNILIHAAPRSVAPGTIDAATAYSISHHSRVTRVIIGDPLPLRLSVRWYPNTALPSGWSGVGGHLYLSTVVYCLLSAGAAVAVCVAYFRGVEFPRRLRSHGRERLGGGAEGFGGSGVGRMYGGYGYGMSTVYNGTGTSNGFGKRD